MKNLTVKKVALGLFLAGYAASSAFAISATTSKHIEGNLPVFKSNVDGAAEHTMTLKIWDRDKPTEQIGTKPAKVGDIITIEFNLEDADSDTMTASTIKDTFKIFIKKDKDNNDEEWKEVTHDKIQDLATTITGNKGQIKFTIPTAFAGAEHIGYQLLERTEYGAPYANKWLMVTDIWSSKVPNAVDPGDKENPLTPPKELTGDKTGPGDSTNNGSGPIESSTTKIGIFKITGASVETNSPDYSRTKDANEVPKYGEKFAAVVWMDDNDDDKLDAGEVTKTGSYTFTWTLTGSYDYEKLNNITGKTPLEAKKVDNKYEALTQNISDGTGDWDTGTNNVIILGSTDTDNPEHNKVYDTSYYPAGAQGYNLTVTTN